MKLQEFRKLIREEVHKTLKEELEKIKVSDLNRLPKEELLDLFIEVMNNHYRGPGWKGDKYAKSLPTFKQTKKAIISRMR